MNKLYVLFMAVIGAVLIAWVVYTSYLFYAAPCQKVKDFPLPVYAPNRCIK